MEHQRRKKKIKASTVVKIAVAIPIAVLNYLIGKIIFRKKTEPEYEDF